jgi:hypothetical protein
MGFPDGCRIPNGIPEGVHEGWLALPRFAREASAISRFVLEATPPRVEAPDSRKLLPIEAPLETAN